MCTLTMDQGTLSIKAVIDEKWIVEKCIKMVYTEGWTEQDGNEILESVNGMDG